MSWYFIGLLLVVWNAMCAEVREDIGFLHVTPNDNVYYYLRVALTNINPLLIWLGHTPAHAIGHNIEDTAIPQFDNNISFVMFDFPNVGLTKSTHNVMIDSLSEFVKLSLNGLIKKYPYGFNDIWIGGERLMTPLVTTLAQRLSGYGFKVSGLIMGNPYLEGRISLPKRLEVMKHFGILDTERKEQFTFLNNLCVTNTSIAECNRTESLFGIVTNKTYKLTAWSHEYIDSILSKSDYLSNFIEILKSRQYKILIYTSQIDLNSGFQRVYSVLQDFHVGNTPHPLTYYLHNLSIKGFYRQNDYWTLLNIYNSSGNITHSQPEVIGSAIKEFMKNGNLSCEKNCGMENEIMRIVPSCKQQNWTTGEYLCKCANNKYGATCSIDVEEMKDLEQYKGYLDKDESVYIKYESKGKGFIELERKESDCVIDMYANYYLTDGVLDTPTEKNHAAHVRTDVIYTPEGVSIVMLKIKSKCDYTVEVSLKYYQQQIHKNSLYLTLTIVLCLLIIFFVAGTIVIYVKARKRKDRSLLLRN